MNECFFAHVDMPQTMLVCSGPVELHIVGGTMFVVETIAMCQAHWDITHVQTHPLTVTVRIA